MRYGKRLYQCKFVNVKHCHLTNCKTRRPASADKTAHRQFQATGQPVSRMQSTTIFQQQTASVSISVMHWKYHTYAVHFYEYRQLYNHTHLHSRSFFYSAPQCSHCKRCTSYGNSVCLTQAGIVSKRRHVARCSLHCQIAKCV